MKTFILSSLIVLTSFCGSAQIYFGLQGVGGGFSGISPYYGKDSYNILNYPTAKADIWDNNNTLHHINFSGIFYWIGGLKTNTDGNVKEGSNVMSTTDKGFHSIQDRVGIEYVKTSFNDNTVMTGKGWQIGVKRFGLGQRGVLKSSIPDSAYIGPDNGPYYNGNALTVGFNFQRNRQIGTLLTLRTGVFINGIAGIYKFGGQIYPKVMLEAKYKFVSLRLDAAYELNAYYGITQKAYRDFYTAENTGIVHNYRVELSVGFDLKSK